MHLVLVALLVALGSGPAHAQSVQYQLVFEGFWAQSHIALPFPAGAHFTRLVGATHDAGDPLWSPGDLASAGIENVAEFGSPGFLWLEVDARIAAGTAGTRIESFSLSDFPAESSTTFWIETDHPEITLISMVAPTPDWFVGVSGLPLRQGGGWVQSLTVDLSPWDAGTEQGNAFSLDNPPSAPQEPIAPRGAPFLPGAVIGRIHLTLVTPPGAPALPPGGLALLAAALLGTSYRVRRATLRPREC